LISKFMAPPYKRAWPSSTYNLVKAAVNTACGFIDTILRPLVPYESGPREPAADLPEHADWPSEEQLAQCQAIFDQSEARRAHIEQKAQWAFTVIAFLLPSLASVLVFLIRDPAFEAANGAPSLVLLLVSACLLLLSFFSAWRALAIRGRQILHLGAIIDGENGDFLNYDRTRHAQGLLYCATMNTATNDHIAQFVKDAHVLVAFAVVTFASGAVATGLQLTARPAPPVRAEVVGTVSLSPTDLSGLHSDIREVAAALATLATATSKESQMNLLVDRVATLEAEVNTLRNQVPIAGDSYPAHSTRSRPPLPAKPGTAKP
jgi:hypothetical protein